MKICVICEAGWILFGSPANNDVKGLVSLTDASVVRSWYNGRGIGGIAKKEYRNEYTLDYIGNVDIYANKVLFTIPCEE